MTIRTGLLIFGILLILATPLIALAVGPFAIQSAITGIVIVLGVLVERIVYKPVDNKSPGPGWRPTDERFVDPVSGQTVTVFVWPETCERRYVETGHGR